MGEDILKSVWNFDDAEYKLIFLFKSEVASCLMLWDLMGAYWSLRRLRSEIDAKVSDKERMDINKDVDNLDKEKNTYEENINDKKKQANFYISLDNFYRNLCQVLKHHGSFFREQEDEEGL